jgi:DNA-binding transcriptional LysR family regulator
MYQIDGTVGIQALRALVAVSDAGSFRAAAAQLGYTQSAVSHQIAVLERSLGAQLLTRPGGRAPTALTTAGETAYRHARRALEAIESMGADVRAIYAERGTVRVGIFQTAAAALLPAALADFRRERPNVTIELTEPSEHRSVVEALAQGRLDLAVTINPEHDDRVEVFPLLEDGWVILAREDSEIARAPDPSFELLHGADVIAWREGWCIQDELEEALRRKGIEPRIVYRTDDNLALQRFVAAGLGCACIGRLGAESPIDPVLRTIVPRDAFMRRSVALVHPRRRELPAPVQTLVEQLRAHARELAGDGPAARVTW